jgi:hypothetical protein
MKIIIGTFVALLLGSTLISNTAEANCWWNGYNHCRSYHHVSYRDGYHHHHYHHGYWYR